MNLTQWNWPPNFVDTLIETQNPTTNSHCNLHVDAKDTLVIISYFNKNRINLNIYIELIEVYSIQITV